jgi:hypothetical protein
MANVSSIMKQLKQERDRVAKQLSGMDAALTAFAGVYSKGQPIRKRRKLSAKSRAKIAAAQRERWCEVSEEVQRLKAGRTATCSRPLKAFEHA